MGASEAKEWGLHCPQGWEQGRPRSSNYENIFHKLSCRQCNVVMSLLCLNKYVEIKDRGYGILLDGAALCRLFIVLQSEDNINFKDNKKVVDFDFSHILVQ